MNSTEQLDKDPQLYTSELEAKNIELAREIRIETELEKVRSRSMIMQSSSELREVVQVVFASLEALEFAIDGAAFIITGDGTHELDTWIGDNHTEYPSCIKIPYYESPTIVDIWNAKLSGLPSFAKTYSKEEKNHWFQYAFANIDDFRHLPEDLRKWILEQDYLTQFFAIARNSMIGIHYHAAKAPTDKEVDILKRFSTVFDYAYTRFLDLQKAEAQAREAQIQLGLERVRTRAMAMQNSEELNALIGTVFIELTRLDIQLTRCLIMTNEPETNATTWWMANSEAPDTPMNYFVPYHDNPPYLAYVEAWRQRQLKFVYVLEGQEKKEWDDYIFSETGLAKLPDFVIAGMRAPDKVYLNASFNNFGNLTMATLEPLSDEHAEILLRFAKVFDLTYTRFNDLLQAEAQTKEAQIQLALERVRARTMAMQKSDELPEAANNLFQQLQSLGIPAWSAGYGIWVDDRRSALLSMSSEGLIQKPFIFPTVGEGYNFEEPLQKGKGFYVKELGGEDLVRHYQFMRTLPVVGEILDGIINAGFPLPTYQIFHVVYFTHGYLLFITYEPVVAHHDIFQRFGKVFDQTYTRFLDLQKAEAQAREAHIEAALEKVRSRTMAMQKSDELAEVIQVVYSQLANLNMHVEHAGFIIDYKERDDMHIWLADEHAVPTQIVIPYFDSPHWNSFREAKAKGADLFVNLLNFEEKNKFYRELFTFVPVSDETLNYYLNCPGLAGSTVLLENIGLYIENFSGIPYTDEENKTLMRFGKVFQQTYTRFLDLQKAEAQARESRIEAALEKVRGKAMAMHNSNDLSLTASMVFTELRKLNITPIRCGVGLLTKDSKKSQLYSTTSTAHHESLSLVGWVLLEKHPVLTNIYDHWLRNEDYFPQLSGEEIKPYYQMILEGLPVKVPESTYGKMEYGSFISISVGCLYTWSAQPYNDNEIRILKRFAAIVDLTFRRYIELKKSEASAREAVKQAALDRIRADIASMRTVADLNRIIPLVWNELTILGVPFIRCGVFIMDEKQETVHSFLSLPDGEAIAGFHISYDTPGPMAPVIDHWRKNEIHTDYWDTDAFKTFAAGLVEQGVLTSAEQYLRTLPTQGFHLHFLPFLQGMLYVGNTDQLSDEDLALVKLVADAFSTAYARYEDFNKLEAAKEQVDKTLVELRQTQQQLIQSEKMASLGELTAGIAHEIQNPLNFVNNFSDVNKELLAEMIEEIEKGNLEEAKSLATGIAENEHKINHHGKRADSIVKGMLQHSRSSTGQKETADLNALAEEYLKLSYQAFRSKDKLFNTSLEIQLDKTIGNIQMVPQDIGRVLLNLYNNAFYAVHAKKNGFGEEYKPKVEVSTRKLNGMIEIAVCDNGTGIPQKIIDRIYHPFFTTKPTGEGTGLGLSLSYDIIKAHNGEIKVETVEGDGTKFFVLLPAAG